VATEVRLEDIQQALSGWARQEVALKDRVRLLENRIEDLSLVIKHAVEQMQTGFELPVNPNITLQLLIEEALLAVQTRGDSQVRTIATQKDQLEIQAAKIAGLDQEVQESIDRMVAELELPVNRHRTLRNATTEVCGMVVEAKKIIQEHL
jgi:hypothetical protein